MEKLNKKGFTLIELLVVIAIIGILASIVLVSLNGARNKGYDTQVKSDMSQIRNLMEMCYDDNGGTYTGCITGTPPTTINTHTFTPPTCSTVYNGYDSTSAWAYNGKLCSTAKYWCVDSTGVSKLETSALTTTVCS